MMLLGKSVLVSWNTNTSQPAIHPTGRGDVLNVSLMLFLISSVLVQYGEEQHNALKVTSSTDTLFIQFQQNSIIV